MKHIFTGLGIRSICLLPLLLIFCPFQKTWAQCTLSVSEVHTDVTCSGTGDGTATITVSGGAAPYKLTLFGEDIYFDPYYAITGLSGGDYDIEVIDADGCVADVTIHIAEPEPLSMWFEDLRSPTCYGYTNGSATVKASGGTEPYSFTWLSLSVQGGSQADYLPAGEIEVDMIDAHGCFAAAAVVITQPDPVSARVVSSTDASCAGATDGTVTLEGSGGTAPYFFDGSSEFITGLNAYQPRYIHVTDINGCDGGDIVVGVSEPEEISLNVVSTTPVSCYGGSDGTVDLQASGGVGPYTYFTLAGEPTPSGHIEGFYASDYYLTATDAHGCRGPLTYVVVTQPEELSATVSSIKGVSCTYNFDGEVTLQASGGTAPYRYEGSPSGEVSLSGVITGLWSGAYTFIVTDSRGCMTFPEATVPQPEELYVDVVAYTPPSCHGTADATVTLQGVGGTAPYVYNYGSTSALVEGLPARSYNWTVTDVHGCVGYGGSNVEDPAPVEVITTHTDVMCDGTAGSASVMDVMNGNPGYTYAWSPGEWTTPSVNDLMPGTYTVVVTDAHGCQGWAVETVGGEICESLTLVSTAISANSDGQNDTFRVLAEDVGSVQLNVYDMYGKPVFSTTDVKAATETGWDGRCQGKDVPEGWYIWTLHGTHTDGRSLTPKGGQRGRLVLSR